jgi:2-polyprenyl-3-methyl-5-hydroxy-6-metoxy-1,4-benzoquinol methylase
MFRYQEEQKYKNFGTEFKDNIDVYWNDDYDLADTVGWDQRYDHEASIISDIIETCGIKKVLELGSGPGTLATKILNKVEGVNYFMIDGKGACNAHARRNNKGSIIEKNLYDSFDTSGLDSDFDLIIANDFLEHIRNPSLILEKSRELTSDNSWFFVSSPNWRMKHRFYYPGLFDFDNLVKFFWQESYSVVNIFPSWSNHVFIKAPRLNSESQVPEGHIYDWNYYLLFKKVT